MGILHSNSMAGTRPAATLQFAHLKSGTRLAWARSGRVTPSGGPHAEP